MSKTSWPDRSLRFDVSTLLAVATVCSLSSLSCQPPRPPEPPSAYGEAAAEEPETVESAAAALEEPGREGGTPGVADDPGREGGTSGGVLGAPGGCRVFRQELIAKNATGTWAAGECCRRLDLNPSINSTIKDAGDSWSCR
jgi:hypothetical protein